MITPELVLECYGDSPICIHRYLLTLTKSVTAALFLTYANFEMADLPPASNGWFAKSKDDWEAEIGLSRFEQESARKILRDLGLLEEKRTGIPARLFYRVNAQALVQMLGTQAKANHGASLKAYKKH